MVDGGSSGCGLTETEVWFPRQIYSRTSVVWLHRISIGRCQRTAILVPYQGREVFGLAHSEISLRGHRFECRHEFETVEIAMTVTLNMSTKAKEGAATSSPSNGGRGNQSLSFCAIGTEGSNDTSIK